MFWILYDCSNRARYKYLFKLSLRHFWQISDLEKEKTMLELEVKELIARHKTELQEKASKVTQASFTTYIFAYIILFCFFGIYKIVL